MEVATRFTFVFISCIVIIVHLLRIIYLVFKPRFLSKYEFISSKELSDWQLILYYTLAILTLTAIVLSRLGVVSTTI
jgi:hypothetical protein